MDDGPQPVMTRTELNEFLLGAFPGGIPFEVAVIAPSRCTMTMTADGSTIRPGGTVSGPTLMSMADAVAYAVVLGHIGPVALAVTSTLTINFLRKPEPGVLRAEAELLKLGRTQAVVDVRLHAGVLDPPVAQATVTYAIPLAPQAPVVSA